MNEIKYFPFVVVNYILLNRVVGGRGGVVGGRGGVVVGRGGVVGVRGGVVGGCGGVIRGRRGGAIGMGHSGVHGRGEWSYAV